jgi:hypothetical protein
VLEFTTVFSGFSISLVFLIVKDSLNPLVSSNNFFSYSLIVFSGSPVGVFSDQFSSDFILLSSLFRTIFFISLELTVGTSMFLIGISICFFSSIRERFSGTTISIDCLYSVNWK